jgi:hypothetical protein
MPNKINTKAQLIKQTKSTNSIWDLKCIRRISKTVLCWGSVCPNLQSKSAAQLLGDKWCSAFNSNDAKLKWFLCDILKIIWNCLIFLFILIWLQCRMNKKIKQFQIILMMSHKNHFNLASLELNAEHHLSPNNFAADLDCRFGQTLPQQRTVLLIRRIHLRSHILLVDFVCLINCAFVFILFGIGTAQRFDLRAQMHIWSEILLPPWYIAINSIVGNGMKYILRIVY